MLAETADGEGRDSTDRSLSASNQDGEGSDSTDRTGSATDLVAPPTEICWWDTEPQYSCTGDIPDGREPTCPTCCEGCFVKPFFGSWYYARIQVGEGLSEEMTNEVVPTPDTLQPLVILGTSPGEPPLDYAKVPIDLEAALTNAGAYIPVSAEHGGAENLYLWFVEDLGVGKSRPIGPVPLIESGGGLDLYTP